MKGIVRSLISGASVTLPVSIAVSLAAILAVSSCSSVDTRPAVQTEAEDSWQSSTPAPAEELVEDISFLDGTVWECEVQRGDFIAYDVYTITGGTAKFSARMGNAVDEHPDLYTVELRGNRITFIRPDGGVGQGILDGDTISFEDGRVFVRKEK